MASIQYEIDGNEALDGQIAQLRLFPQLFDAKFRPGMQEAVSTLFNEVEPRVPTLSGSAKDALFQKVSGKGYYLTGRVGFGPVAGVPLSESWYPNAVNYGAKPHLILPKAAAVMAIGKRITSGQNGIISGFRGVIHHPGFAPRFFMQLGFAAARPMLNMLFGRAGDALVDALVYKKTSKGGGRASYNKR